MEPTVRDQPQTATTTTSISDKKIATRAVPVGPLCFGGGTFHVIAGPCSIESKEQFLSTAQFVKSAGARMLRGGIFKMRTSPSSFQGLGESAMQIAKAV